MVTELPWIYLSSCGSRIDPDVGIHLYLYRLRTGDN